MVTARREAVNTVAFIDNYCQHYCSSFEDVRHFEAFKFLHLGMMSEVLGKTENGIVSVNAYGVVDKITYPLIFKIFKPKNRLKEVFVAEGRYQQRYLSIQIAVAWKTVY